ncbi:hypothetical protein [Streptomyces sp. NPDC000931]|uniref:hypothetical protein n=1 Tax=Streptomyces sp. NPDC000931 TaxID=3154372 RepID=UPI003332FF80
MNETSPETPDRLELTSNERRMLWLLTMLPAPRRMPGDDLDLWPAQKFWTTMSEHLGAVRDPEGKMSQGAAHAGALIEESLISIRRGLEPAAGVDPEFALRLGTHGLARVLFRIFGELSDRQTVVLGEALVSRFDLNSSGFTYEWLRQLRETAMNVIVEPRRLEGVAENPFHHLDKIWGHPTPEERIFPVDLDGVRGESARAAEQARQRKSTGA